MSVPPPSDGPSGDPPRRRPRGAARRAEPSDSSWADLVGVGGAWSDDDPVGDRSAGPSQPAPTSRAAEFWGAAPSVGGPSGAEVRGPLNNPLEAPPGAPGATATPPGGTQGTGRRRAAGLPDAGPDPSTRTPPRGQAYAP